MRFDKNQIQIEVNFIPNEGQGSINYNSVSAPQGNNISSLDFDDADVGENPFIIGASPMGGGSTFWDNNIKLDYFMGFKLSDASGNFSSQNVITFQGQNISMFQLNFNPKYKRWATQLIVNGVNYANNGSQFIWRGTPTNTINITILKVNQPLYPIEITSILIGLVKVFDKSNLIQDDVLVVGSKKSLDSTLPRFAINSNYGRVSFLDKNDYLKNLVQLGILKASSEIPVKIIYNGNIIGDFISESWDMRYESQKVYVELKDELSSWDSIYFEGLGIISTNTYESFFDKLNNLTPQNVNISNELRLELRSIICPDGYISSGTLMEAWNTFCEASQVNIIKKGNGEIWCV